MPQINPHYNPEKLGLTMISFEEQDMSYEFNILCFWSTGDGRVYTAPDPDSQPVETVELTSPVVPEVVAKAKAVVKAEAEKAVARIYCISDWSKGQATGYKHGKAHQKRLFYEVDKGRKFRRYSGEFVDGYLAGYRDGRGL